ncbi:membrane fusion protein (multidrug efflux system) [Edaphobacter aggregans]|uniref:Membrane fusion protein (Multidrug efflux system) n=1 Tax=Edaphobacter aggregans TaxID=570835 RepID=A0A3R9NWE9_9BACT|nr:efflux RND transporter periplasmic adaptor subunit [Edaphobacter aggregans]RSL18397.1 membrane fusion protein (multidrug efflux system) [Edaphobacter aggregans]
MKIKSVLKPKQVAWVSGVLLAAILGVAVSRSAAKPSTQTPSSPLVEVALVEQRDVPINGEWIGTLTGQVNADVKAQVTGYLLTRNYKEGSFVRKGQILFEIDPRPFQAALDQARGQFAQAQAQLAQDEAQLSTSEANRLKSQLNVEKYEPLAKVDAVSKQDFDNATQTDFANKAQVKAAEAGIAAAKAQIKASEATVETASINLSFTRIVAPIDGIAGIAQAQVGDLVSSSSSPLTTVSTLDPIRDYFTVSEQQYLALQKRFSDSEKDHWKLQLILADGTTYPQEGQFYFADRQVNPNTGAIQLAALFPNPGNVLRPGQYGKVRAIVRVQQNALLIPQAAVNEQQGSNLVAVVDKDNRVSMRPVQVGQRTDTMWVIDGGLKPGDRVIVEGQQNVRPGMTVQTKPFKNNVE